MEPIHVPEHAEGSGFRLLPEGPAVIMLEKLTTGKSKEGNPKLIGRYVVTEEMPNADPNEEPTIGAIINEDYSLLPQALFKIGQDFKAVTGESIPQGDYATPEDFLDVVNVICGSEWDAILTQEIPPGQDKPRTKISTKVYRG